MMTSPECTRRPWIANPLFAAGNDRTPIFVVEATDGEQAWLRANCIAPLYGLRNIPREDVARIDECPRGVPVFLEGFFASLGPDSAVLTEGIKTLH